MDDQHVRTVLGYLDAAQVVLAIYGAPDGPTDPLECHNTLATILEDSVLLRAQHALVGGDKILSSLKQSVISSIVPCGGGGPAFLNEDKHGQVHTTTSGH